MTSSILDYQDHIVVDIDHDFHPALYWDLLHYMTDRGIKHRMIPICDVQNEVVKPSETMNAAEKTEKSKPPTKMEELMLEGNYDDLEFPAWVGEKPTKPVSVLFGECFPFSNIKLEAPDVDLQVPSPPPSSAPPPSVEQVAAPELLQAAQNRRPSLQLPSIIQTGTKSPYELAGPHLGDLYSDLIANEMPKLTGHPQFNQYVWGQFPSLGLSIPHFPQLGVTALQNLIPSIAPSLTVQQNLGDSLLRSSLDKYLGPQFVQAPPVSQPMSSASYNAMLFSNINNLRLAGQQGGHLQSIGLNASFAPVVPTQPASFPIQPTPQPPFQKFQPQGMYRPPTTLPKEHTHYQKKPAHRWPAQQLNKLRRIFDENPNPHDGIIDNFVKEYGADWDKVYSYFKSRRYEASKLRNRNPSMD